MESAIVLLIILTLASTKSLTEIRQKRTRIELNQKAYFFSTGRWRQFMIQKEQLSITTLIFSSITWMGLQHIPWRVYLHSSGKQNDNFESFGPLYISSISAYCSLFCRGESKSQISCPKYLGKQVQFGYFV